jgi:uncharacterized damage-inducible protein DinB
MPDNEIALILRTIDQAFDHRSWHGTNLRGSIRRLDASAAAWRPAPERHNIWEIVVHAAYWKYTVRRRLLGERRGSFPLKGSDWFVRPDGTTAGDRQWREDTELLVSTHRSLREAVTSLDPRALDAPTSAGKTTTVDLLTGIAAHDLYHAGQIQLLKRLRADARR